VKKSIGSFTFEYLGLDECSIPKYSFKVLQQQELILYEAIIDCAISDVVQNIKNNIWTEDGYALEISFEDISFCFYKIDLPICGWDEVNELSYDILVRLTSAEYNNTLATMTTIEELEEFAKWYENIKKLYYDNRYIITN